MYPQHDSDSSHTTTLSSPHHATRGFAQSFGLHPAISLLTLAVDSMLFTGEAVSLGTSLPFSFLVSIAVGVIAYKAQRKWFGDDKESASIKAGILILLCAIPTGLPAFVYLPMGVLGFFRRSSPAPQISSPSSSKKTDGTVDDYC